jgi:hypothetical protein
MDDRDKPHRCDKTTRSWTTTMCSSAREGVIGEGKMNDDEETQKKPGVHGRSTHTNMMIARTSPYHSIKTK